MKLLICYLLLVGVGVLAEERAKRQASYTFPGPRGDRSHSRQAAAGYRSGQPQSVAAVYVDEEDDDSELYQPPRRQFQAQPVQPQYPQARSQPAPPPAAPPAYEPPRAAPAPEARPQSYNAPAPSRRASSSSRGRSKYVAAPQQSLNGHEEEEVDEGPDALTLLLQDSQFTCGGKADGYYADDSVNCQVFHYCVGGAKHSWMCPENTVFHQVHLNCVPDAQDICAQSQKFHFVNDYLYKPVDYQGPNNTARYSQRYYPDGYVVGDPLVPPQEQAPPRRAPAPPAYPASAPAPRPPPRQVAPPAPSYRPAAQPPQYSQGPSRPSRPSRPAESYAAEVPQAAYRGSSSAAASPPSSSGQSYRPAAPQQVGPSPQAYRIAAQQAAAPAPQSGYSEDNLYQPQPVQSRRPAAPPQRTSSGYAPPRSYRPTSARSAAGYPVYSSNQAAGVQYDEDY